jgi:Na+-transporting methylmalonyl-CoA/oxaloacetate decarboxylase beta subunit
MDADLVRMVLLMLLLAGCSAEPVAVTVAPRLSCDQKVECHVYMWRIGLPIAGVPPVIGGTHFRCECA